MGTAGVLTVAYPAYCGTILAEALVGPYPRPSGVVPFVRHVPFAGLCTTIVTPELLAAYPAAFFATLLKV